MMMRILTFLLGLKDLGDLEFEGLSVQCAPLAPVGAILLLGLVGFTVLSVAYRGLLGTVTPRVRRGLLAVRLLLFALALSLLFHPVLTVEGQRFVKGLVPVLIDSSQSMTIRDVNGGGRFRAAENAARAILSSLGDRHAARPYIFSREVAPQTLATDTSLPPPQGTQTDLAAALTSVRHELAGQCIDGIVLITDGGSNHGRDPVVESGKLGVPVYTVGVGGQPEGPDLQITEVRANPFPFRNDTSRAQVALRCRELRSALTGEVRLKHQGRLLASSRFEMPGRAGSETVVSVDYVPDRKGPMELTLEAIGPEADQVPQNNRRVLRVLASSDKVRVLMLDGRPRWEYGFIHRALRSDPHVSVVGETKVATEMVYKQSDAYTRLGRAIFPRSLRELSQFDVVIIGDVKRSLFSVTQLFDIEAFVAEQGGGLILLGGQHTLGADQHYAKSPISKLLPFVYPPEAAHEAGEVALGLTAEGRRHPVTRLRREPEHNAALWRELPPLSGCWQIGRIKPSAVTLASARNSEGGPGHPAVVAQRYGKGRSLVFAGDSSWRWGLCPELPDQAGSKVEEEPNYHYRFWENAVRWVSGEISDPDERTFVASSRNVYEVGDMVHLLARVLDEDCRPIQGAAVSASVSRGGEELASLGFKPESGARGFYRAAFRPDEEGDCTVTVKSVLPRDGKPDLVGESETTVSVESPNREFREIPLDDGLLREIAAASGGRYFPVDEVNAVAAELGKSTPMAPDAFEIDPVNAPITWLLFVALLFGEWIYRKTRGLA